MLRTCTVRSFQPCHSFARFISTALLTLVLASSLSARQWLHRSPTGLTATIAHGAEWDSTQLYLGTVSDGLFLYNLETLECRQLELPDAANPGNTYDALPTWTHHTLLNLPANHSRFWGTHQPVNWIGSNRAFPDILLVHSGRELYRSNDRGETWEESGLNGVLHVSLHAGGASVTCESNQVYRLNPSNGEFDSVPTSHPAEAFNFSPSTPDSMWYGDLGYFNESTNLGINWESLHAGWTVQIEMDEQATDAVWFLTTNAFISWPELRLYRPSLGSISNLNFWLPEESFSITPDGNAVVWDWSAWYRYTVESPATAETLSVVLDQPDWLAPNMDGARIGWVGGTDSTMVFAGPADLIIQPLSGPGQRIDTPSTSNMSIWTITSHPLHPDTAFAAGLCGLYRTFDAGEHWERCLSTTVYDVTLLPSEPLALYATTTEEVLKSNDGGATWQNSFTLPGGMIYSPTHIAQHPSDSQIAWMVTRQGRLMRTVDGGTSWDEPFEELHPSASAPILFDPANPNRLFTVGDGILLVLTIGEDTWDLISSPGQINNIEIMTNPSWKILVSTSNGVYSKNTLQQNWQQLPSPELNWDSVAFGKLQADPSLPGVVWLMGIGKGLYSLDLLNDQTWDPFTLPDPHVACTFELTPSGRIYLGTSVDGAWVLADRFSSLQDEHHSVPLPNSLHLTPPWPNPFNSTLNLRFDLRQAENTSIQLFNLQGRLVRTIFEGEMSAGEHRAAWHPDGLASGMYLVRIEAGGVRELRKVVYLK